MAWVDVTVPYELGELVSLFHRRGLIESEEHTGDGTHITGRVPRGIAGQFEKLMGAEEA